MSEVILQFPYLSKGNENGIMLSGSSRGILDKLINYGTSPIQVTLYPDKSELDYAINSSARYVIVDPQFVAGKVTGFNPSNGKIYIDVTNDENVSVVKNGKFLPRMQVKKVNDGNIEKLEIVNVISIDILQQ